MSINHQLPREVPQERREAIIEALKSDQFDWWDSGYRYLDQVHDLDPEAFVFNEVLPYLESGHRLYVLPENPNFKSQCCIELEEDLVIYVKLSEFPDNNGLFIKFDSHSPNTGYRPLPK